MNIIASFKVAFIFMGISFAILSSGVSGAMVPPLEPEFWAARPIVIAHRGASGYRPEHSLSSFRQAIDLGADYLEPDLVMSKDGVLVVRHDVYLSTSTDINMHPEFKDRRRSVGGRLDWYVFDFTVAELKTLKTIQPFKGRSKDWDGLDSILTFDELISLARDTLDKGKTVGLYIEIKRPNQFKEIGLDPTPELVAGSVRARDHGIPVYIQSFDGEYLGELAKLSDIDLILLIDRTDKDEIVSSVTDVKPFLDFISGVGIHKSLLLKNNKTLRSYASSLKEKGLLIHAWTFRDDDLGDEFTSPEAELEAFFEMGIDGVFTDFPDTAIKVRDRNRLIVPPFIQE